MQDPSIYPQLKPQFPDQEHLKCPRCDSGNTKFCYYNNYNLSQPRHFCKNCRRYWTKGGALRNIPVGGGTRKNSKRSSSKRSSSATTTSTSPPPPLSTSPSAAVVVIPAVASTSTSSTTPPATVQTHPKSEPFPPATVPTDPKSEPFPPATVPTDPKSEPFPPAFGNYGSILSSGEGQFGHFYDGSNLQLYGSEDPSSGQPGNGSNIINSEGFLNGHHQSSNNGEGGIWNGTNGWPDLAIFTPGSNFR